MYRLKAQVSDVDRNVYQTLDLRLAQHPSETLRYMLTRAIAYCLCFQEGIDFSHGLSHADEPALWVKTPDGRLQTWIEVGTPAAERLHRASKACSNVIVFTHHDLGLLRKEAARAPIHRADSIQVFAIESALLATLESTVERNMHWEVLRSDEQLYITVNGQTTSAPLSCQPLLQPQ
jgi:uncharacterized protein YaeQ